MKKFGTKLTLLLMAFVFVTVAVCCAATIGNNASAPVVAAETEISNSYFQLTYSTHGIELLLNGDYHDYTDITKADVKAFAKKVVSALRDVIANGILDKVGGVALATDIPEDIGNIDPSDFDWNSSELLSQFKDYVVDRLGSSEEFQKYVDGEYDLIIDFAIGSYIESKKDEIEDLQAEYDKIQSAIQDVVDEAYVSAVEDAKQELGDYFDEDEWIAKKEQASNKVVERVESVQENGGTASISIKQLISAVKEISINGNALYSSGNGLCLDGIRSVLGSLPTPQEIANMSDSQMASLIDWDLRVDTTFGDVNFNLSFGLFGNLSSIRTLAQKIANNISLSVNGSDVAFEVNVPEVFTKALRKFYTSAHFTDNQKQIVFDLFNKSLSEVEISDAISFFKDVDYQYWISNFYNAEYMNYYFGSYVSKILDRQFTDTTIDNLITKIYNFVAPKAERVQDISLDEVKNWLNDNVPGASRVTDSSKLNSLAEKLLSIIRKIDWAKYDAEYIREVILGDEIDFNGKIVSYLDRFENSERFYDASVRYLEKAIELLPSKATSKSLLDCFEDGSISFSYSYTVDFDNIFSRAANFIRRYGYDTIANYVDNASVLLDRSTIDISLSAKVNLNSIYRVDYEVNDQIVSSGLLPAGLNGEIVSSLSNIQSVDGYDILYWTIKGENDAIEAMPNNNIVLVPVFGFSAAIDGAVDAIYDEANEYELKAVITDGIPGAAYSYAWYKDGQFLSDEESISVKFVKDSGVYGLQITDTKTGFVVDCDDVVVNIAHKSVQAPAAWDEDYSFVYGEEISVEYDAILPEIYTQLVYSYNDGENAIEDIASYEWNVGQYFVEAVVELLDENYVSSDGERSWTLNATIEVTPKIVAAPEAWDDEYRVTFGSPFEVAYNGIASDSQYAYTDIAYSYSQNGNAIDINAEDFVWNAGTYNVVASFALNSNNYATADGVREWNLENSIQILPKTLDVNAQWVNVNTSEVDFYDGREHSAYVVLSGENLNDDELYYVNSIITYTVNGEAVEQVKVIDAGDYELVAILNETDDNYIVSAHYLNPYTYTIRKAQVVASITWSYTEPFVYDGQAKFVGYSLSLKHNENEIPQNCYTVEKDGVNTRTDCGEYSYSIKVTLSNNNYIFNNSQEFVESSIDWQINPKNIEIDQFGNWSALDAYSYGDEIDVQYQLTNPEYFNEVSYKYFKGEDEIALGNWNVGQYKIVAHFELISSNYIVNGSETSSWDIPYSLDITSKVFDLDGAEWIAPENASYDGNAKEIYLSLDNTSLSDSDKAIVLANLSYTLGGEAIETPIEVVNAGTYTVAASCSNPNYSIIVNEFEYTITKGQVAVNVTFNYEAPFEYDGQEHRIEYQASLTLNGAALNVNDYEITSEGLSAVQSGNYTAKVVIVLKNASLELVGESEYTCVWVINARATIEPFGEGHQFTSNDGIVVTIVSGTVPGNYEFNSNAAELTDAQKATISNLYAGKKISYVSVYDIHFNDSDIDEKEVEGSFKVSMPIPATYKEVSADKLAIVHITSNGSVKKVEASRNGDNMEFISDGFSVYAIIGLDIEATKTYDLSGAKWTYAENKVYDGNNKVIDLDLSETNLSDEDKVFIKQHLVYTLNGESTITLPYQVKEAGTYNISASLDSDAIAVTNIPAALEYVITKGQVYVEVFFESASSFEYDGQEHSINITYTVVFNGADLDEDAYTVTITGDKAVESGDYTARVVIELNNASLELASESVYEYNWSINKRVSDNPFEAGHEFTSNDGIIVEIKEGSIPADYEVSSEKSSVSDSELDKIKELYEGKKLTVIVAYDIHFVNGAKVEQKANGTFKVTMPIPEAYRSVDADKLIVIHIQDDGTIAVVEGASRSGDNMVFETNGFSVYSIIQVEDETPDTPVDPIEPIEPDTPVEPVEPTEPTEPADDEGGLSTAVLIVIIVLAVLLVVALIVIVILAIRRKKLHDDNNPDEGGDDEVTEENRDSITVDTADEAPVEEESAEEATEEGEEAEAEEDAHAEEPVEEEVAEEAVEAPIEEPIEEAPVEEESEESAEEEAVVVDADEAPVEEEVVEEPVAEEEAPIEESEEVPSEEEAPVEEAPAEEPESVEEAPVEEAEEPAEEVVVVVNADEAPAEEVNEEPINEEPVQEDEIQPVEDSSNVDINVDVNFEAGAPTGPQLVQVLDRSFTAKLALAEHSTQANYNAIKNYALSFKNVRSRISWACDSINRGRKKICKIVIKGKNILLYLAIDPETLPEKYHAKSAGKASKYQATPTKLKVRSGRSVKYAKEIIALIAASYELKQGEVQSENYIPHADSEEELIAQGFIKTKLVRARTNSPWKK